MSGVLLRHMDKAPTVCQAEVAPFGLQKTLLNRYYYNCPHFSNWGEHLSLVNKWVEESAFQKGLGRRATLTLQIRRKWDGSQSGAAFLQPFLGLMKLPRPRTFTDPLWAQSSQAWVEHSSSFLSGRDGEQPGLEAACRCSWGGQGHHMSPGHWHRWLCGLDDSDFGCCGRFRWAGK